MCKLRLRLRLVAENHRSIVEAYFHPRGCMKAKLPHLDIEGAEPTWLWRIAGRRGTRLLCRSSSGCIELEEPLTGLTALICPENGPRLHCSREVYVMVTRARRLYVAPVWLQRDGRQY